VVTVAGGLFVIGAMLLLVAGAPKVVAGGAVPWLPPRAARPLGAAECAVGLWALVAPGAGGAIAAAGAYLVLAGALAVALVRHEPDCGCFGVAPVRPDIAHLVVNLLFAAAATTVAATGWSRPDGWEGLLLLALGATAAVLTATLLSTGADVRRLVAQLAEVRSS